MNNDIVLKTDRLVLKNFTMDNFKDFVELNQDKAMMKYFMGGAKDYRGCVLKYQEITETLKDYGYSYYAIYNKENVFIGQAGILNNYDGSLNLCYAIHRKFQRKGFGYEATHAILNYIYSKFDNIDRITAFIFTANVPSAKLLLKLGFKETKRKDTEYGEITYYEIFRKDVIKD